MTRRRAPNRTVRAALSDPSACAVLTTLNGTSSLSIRSPSTARTQRTEPELVVKSRWVAPERLTAAGFAFGHTDLAEALRTSAQGGSTGSSGTGSASVGSVGARR
ncbi:DUF1731 domain-containing protein [Microbacterium lacticum]